MPGISVLTSTRCGRRCFTWARSTPLRSEPDPPASPSGSPCGKGPGGARDHAAALHQADRDISSTATVKQAKHALPEFFCLVAERDEGVRTTRDIRREHVELYKTWLTTRISTKTGKALTRNTVGKRLGLLANFFERATEWDGPTFLPESLSSRATNLLLTSGSLASLTMRPPRTLDRYTFGSRSVHAVAIEMLARTRPTLTSSFLTRGLFPPLTPPFVPKGARTALSVREPGNPGCHGKTSPVIRLVRDVSHTRYCGSGAPMITRSPLAAPNHSVSPVTSWGLAKTRATGHLEAAGKRTFALDYASGACCRCFH